MMKVPHALLVDTCLKIAEAQVNDSLYTAWLARAFAYSMRKSNEGWNRIQVSVKFTKRTLKRLKALEARDIPLDLHDRKNLYPIVWAALKPRK